MSSWKVSSWPTLFSTRVGLDLAGVDAAREVPDALPHRRAERAVEHAARSVEDVGDRADAACLE